MVCLSHICNVVILSVCVWGLYGRVVPGKILLKNQKCWTCGEKPTHMEWREPLGEYEFTCDGCHREQYPQDYAPAAPADAQGDGDAAPQDAAAADADPPTGDAGGWVTPPLYPFFAVGPPEFEVLKKQVQMMEMSPRLQATLVGTIRGKQRLCIPQWLTKAHMESRVKKHITDDQWYSFIHYVHDHLIHAVDEVLNEGFTDYRSLWDCDHPDYGSKE